MEATSSSISISSSTRWMDAASCRIDRNVSARDAAPALLGGEDGYWQLSTKHGSATLAGIDPIFGFDDGRCRCLYSCVRAVMRISTSFAIAIAAALIPQIASGAASMPELEQEALLTGRSEMILTDRAPIKIKAWRGNFIADTGCAFVTVSYITKNPTAEAPNKILVFETTSPVCPAGDENKAVALGELHKG